MALSRFLPAVHSNARRLSALAALLLASGSLAVSGCAHHCESQHDFKEAPPLYATVGRQGKGERLDYLANNPGRAFTYDMCDRHVLHSTHLKVGDRYVVDPDRSQIALNGNVIATPELNPQHAYRIYFLDEYDRDSQHDKH
jgi:hypothetical protein